MQERRRREDTRDASSLGERRDVQRIEITPRAERKTQEREMAQPEGIERKTTDHTSSLVPAHAVMT